LQFAHHCTPVHVSMQDIWEMTHFASRGFCSLRVRKHGCQPMNAASLNVEVRNVRTLHHTLATGWGSQFSGKLSSGYFMGRPHGHTSPGLAISFPIMPRTSPQHLSQVNICAGPSPRIDILELQVTARTLHVGHANGVTHFKRCVSQTYMGHVLALSLTKWPTDPACCFF